MTAGATARRNHPVKAGSTDAEVALTRSCGSRPLNQPAAQAPSIPRILSCSLRRFRRVSVSSFSSVFHPRYPETFLQADHWAFLL